jgi:N-acetylglucosaminyl-diphospho-decaprenol L-rhamnosyltransferase
LIRDEDYDNGSPPKRRTSVRVSALGLQSDIAVVIVNFRTADLTIAAVGSVLGEDQVREVVVLDNASGDGSEETFRSAFSTVERVRVITSPTNVGFGRGVNLAVRHTTSPLLFLLNSDATVRPGSLALLSAALLSDTEIAVAAPALYCGDGLELQAVAHGVFPSLKAVLMRTNTHPPETLWPDWVSGAAMLLRRSDFDAVGGFDPDFSMYMEDVDLCRRFRLMGRTIRRELTSGVDHHSAQSWQPDSDRVTRAHTSRITYAVKAGLPPLDRLAMRALRLPHLWRGRTTQSRSSAP